RFHAVLDGPFRVTTVHEACERHFAVLYCDLDVGGVDLTMSSQPVVDVLANTLVGSLIPARSATAVRSRYVPRFSAPFARITGAPVLDAERAGGVGPVARRRGCGPVTIPRIAI